MRRNRPPPAPTDPLEALTEQERRILELIGEGLTNRQIGERLFLAEKTVKNYVSGLLAKPGMQSRTQPAVYATDQRRDAGSEKDEASRRDNSGDQREKRGGFGELGEKFGPTSSIQKADHRAQEQRNGRQQGREIYRHGMPP